MRLLVASVPLAQGIIGLDIQLNWPHPTYPDDLLQVKTLVQGIEQSSAKPDRGSSNHGHGDAQSARQGCAASNRQAAGIR
jgi:hypothetical protein